MCTLPIAHEPEDSNPTILEKKGRERYKQERGARHRTETLELVIRCVAKGTETKMSTEVSLRPSRTNHARENALT